MKIALPTWSEIGWTRAVACFAILLLTVALAALNVSGAWLASGGNVFYTAVVCGVEILAATVLVLLLAAPTWPRKIVGALTAVAIIFVAVSNGKVSVTHSFASIYQDEQGRELSPAALRLKAGVAEKEAAALAESAPAQMNKDAEEIAALKAEQDLMASSTRIREAQAKLTAEGLYTGRIDGIRENLTEDAMRQRGEAIRQRLDLLTRKTEAKAAPASDKSIEAIDLNAKAAAIDAGRVNLYMLLIACELARTAGLWAFVAWREEKRSIKVDPEVFKDLQAQADELARRKANLDAGVEKRETAKEKRAREKAEREAAILANQLAIEDFRSEQAKREAVEKEPKAEASVDPDAEPVAEAQPDPEPTAENDEDDQPETKAA